MAFVVMTREGVPIQCSTPEEAILMAKAVAQAEAVAERRAKRGAARQDGGGTPAPPATGPTNGSSQPKGKLRPFVHPPEAPATRSSASWEPPEAISVFYDRLSDDQKKAISIIGTQSGEIGLDALRKALGQDSTRETSVFLASCKRAAADLNLDWSKIVEYRISGARENRTSFYKPGPLLLGEETRAVS